MSRLDDLIKELCPDGVEYRSLGDIATDIYRGSGITRGQVKEEGIPCVRYGEIYTTYGVWFDKCVSHTTELEITNRKYFEYGDILFAITGESVEDIAKSCAYTGYERCLAGGDIVVLKHNQDPKYLAYALSTTEARAQKSKGKVKSKVVHSSVPAIKDIVIPVPPLEVQREIVRVLDSFTLLTAELTAELTARKKQYEYYRDTLLETPSWETDEVKLRDVAAYSKERISAAELDEDTYVGVDNLLQMKQGKTKSEHVPTDGNLTRYCSNDILIGNIRPYLRKIWFANNDGGTNGDVLVIKAFSDKVLPKYLYCILSSERFFDYDNNKSKGAKMPRGDKEAVMDFVFKIPNIEVQRQVIDILNKFETICNDISKGLPAEIEARKKQYEYYRDKILAFEVKEQ